MWNVVTLAGYVGKDPEVRSLQDGRRVANFSLATSENWKDKSSGERRESTEWHRIVVFGALAEIVADHVRKGSGVIVQGKIVTRKWTDQKGAERYTTEVQLDQVAGRLRFLPSPREALPAEPEAEEDDLDAPAHEATRRSGTARARKPVPAGNFDADELDDDIPF